MSTAAAEQSDILEVTIEREFSHPVEAVFAAWTQSSALGQWMGPGAVTCHGAQMDARVGGAHMFPMITPDGGKTTARGKILELIPNRKLRLTWAWDQEDGSAGQPMEITLDFHDTGKGTRLVLTHVNFVDAEAREKHTQGWHGCLNNLEDYLAA